MLIFLGDSLLDTGNYFPIIPVLTPLGGQLAVRLGALNSYVTKSAYPSFSDNGNTDIDLFTVPDDNLNFSGPDPLVDLSVSGATTGFFGSTASNLGAYPFGLRSQASSLVAGFSDTSSIYAQKYIGSDVVISAGNNDIFQFLDRTGDAQIDENILTAIGTNSKRDDKRLIDEITGQIASNIADVVNRINGYVDRIAVLGPASLEQIPLFAGVPSELSDFISRITSKANSELKHEFKGRKDVLVINGVKLFNSIVVYDENPITPIPEPLSSPAAPSYYFNDLAHPNSATSDLLASAIADQINSKFSSFGLG